MMTSANMMTSAKKKAGTSHCRAFTLTELLVVVTVMGLLAALLLPSLTKAKKEAQSLACLANLKQLQLCCHLYSQDNNDDLVPNQSGGYVSSIQTTNKPQSIANPQSWCPGLAPLDTTTANVAAGLIFSYNRTPLLYHCPADLSTVSGKPTLPRTRSYCMDICLNCSSALRPYHKLSEMQEPGPADTFVLIDTQEQDIFDATFGIFSPESHWAGYWLDLAADRHNQGANLSFADGHVEFWRWSAPKIFRGVFALAQSPADLTDLQRLEACVRPDGN